MEYVLSNFRFNNINVTEGWDRSTVVDCMLSMHEALGSLASTQTSHVN